MTNMQISYFISVFYVNFSEWYWKCFLQPWVLRVVAVILTIVSFMVVWSECLFFVKDPVLSVFAVFINLAKENYDYVFIEVRYYGLNFRLYTLNLKCL